MPKNNEHIVHRFDQELADLQSSLLEMGGLVEKHLSLALKALTERDSALAEQVRAADSEVDAMETKIDAMCALLIAKRQPAARDMRLIIAAMRSIFDLERCGDEVTKIARLVMAVNENPPEAQCLPGVQRLGEAVARMLKRALDAMARGDAHAAVELTEEDRQTDRECNDLMLLLTKRMQEETDNIRLCLNLLWIVRALERIGDHSCNLTEHVVYLTRGKDIRHVYDLDDIEASLKK